MAVLTPRGPGPLARRPHHGRALVGERARGLSKVERTVVIERVAVLVEEMYGR
jgi:hypothetical protein